MSNHLLRKWYEKHPAKIIAEEPPHYFWVGYDRHQAECQCDGYTELQDVWCEVLHLEEEGKFYVAPKEIDSNR